MVKLERCGAVASHADLRECLHDLLAYEVSRGQVHPQQLEEVLENARVDEGQEVPRSYTTMVQLLGKSVKQAKKGKS